MDDMPHGRALKTENGECFDVTFNEGKIEAYSKRDAKIEAAKKMLQEEAFRVIEAASKFLDDLHQKISQ